MSGLELTRLTERYWELDTNVKKLQVSLVEELGKLKIC